MTQSFDLAQSYITALTGSSNTIMDWRCINDTNKAVAAHNHRGTIAEVFPTLQQYNQSGWGIFVCINSLDGKGRELANIEYIRTHVVDLDDILSSQDSYNRAVATHPQPHFAVQSSPNKFHLYWLVEPYVSNEFYTLQQRKLAQLYNGDKSIIDPTRVLRVPGFYHLKAEPFLTTCWSIHQGARWPVQTIADSLAHINVINHMSVHSPLGDPEMAAPDLEWLKFAMNLLNPNELDRQEWLSITAAFKQAGWTLAEETVLLSLWQNWCSKYAKNDVGENLKLWHSIRETEVGWGAFERRTMVKPYLMRGPNPPTMNGMVARGGEQQHGAQNNVSQVVGSTPAHPTLPELLSPDECAIYFKDCYLIERIGEIFTPSGRFMNQSKFNAKFGGKHFIISEGGKVSKNPWEAAVMNCKWSIPKVDHIRFLPMEKPRSIVFDKLGRSGLNTYIPVKYDAVQGDVTPFLNHMEKMLPDENDRSILFQYIAHCIKFPGYKIRWSPMIQSVEGVGKTLFIEIMKHALGDMYIYTPKAPELVASGSKFNAWMRGKLCIIVDEIKVDERRELIEILKPMITEPVIEIQAKGIDQDLEDNPANWIFLSNFKDAIPINQNGRRYAIFYSTIQSKNDLLKRGMDDNYFNELFYWLKEKDGLRAITHYFLTYPIEKGKIAQRAPQTSSYAEALRISRSPMQIVIEEAIQDEIQGFRGGYVSALAVVRRVTASGTKPPAHHSIRTVLEGMGYVELGRSNKVYPIEDIAAKPLIYAMTSDMSLDGYAKAQGYELNE